VAPAVRGVAQRLAGPVLHRRYAARLSRTPTRVIVADRAWAGGTVSEGLSLVRSRRAVAALPPGAQVVLSDPALLGALRTPAALELVLTGVPARGNPLLGPLGRINQWIVSVATTFDRSVAADPPASTPPGPLAESAVAETSATARHTGVGVFIHAHFQEEFERIAARLRLLPPEARVYVSSTSRRLDAVVAGALPGARRRVVPNRGRDAAGGLFAWAAEHAAHDVVLHLHTKRTGYDPRMRGWLEHALDALLPDADRINRIVARLRADQGVGIVMPAPFGRPLESLSWGRNRAIGEVLAACAGLAPLPSSPQVRFPAGSMYWARTDILQPLLDLGLTAEDFPPERGQRDGTTAHAIERLVGVAATARGTRIVLASDVTN